MKILQSINAEISETQVLDTAPKLDLTKNAFIKKTEDPKTNSDVSKDQVDDIIKTSHEKNKEKDDEEVDTVTFGLETEDNEIVKVYVNMKDADKFEEAMSKMLGKEDSIEDALESLSKEFDIVDVEWPDEDEDEEEEKATSDEDDEEETATKEEDVKEEIKGWKHAGQDLIKARIEKGKTVELHSLKKDGKESGMATARKSFRSEDEAVKQHNYLRQLNPKSNIRHNLYINGKLVRTLESDNETSQQKNEGAENMTLGTTFVKNYLGEAEGEVVFDSGSKEDSLIKSLRLNTPFQNKIINLILLSGFPADILELKKATLRRNIVETARLMLKDATIRVWFGRLLTEFEKLHGVASKEEDDAEAVKAEKDVKEAVEEAGEDGAAENFKDVFKNQIQKNIIELWNFLGIPESLFKTRRAQLRQAVRDTFVNIQHRSRAKTYLGMFVDAIGGGDHRNFDRRIEEAVNLNTTDPYIVLVAQLCSALGIPDENLSFRRAQLVQSLRTKKSSLRNLNLIRTRINMVLDAIEKSTVTPTESTIAKEDNDDELYISTSGLKLLTEMAAGKRGRPRKEKPVEDEPAAPKKPRGRPRKEKPVEDEPAAPKKPRGRPAKVKALDALTTSMTKKAPMKTGNVGDDLSLDDDTADQGLSTPDVEKADLETKKVRMTKTKKLNPEDLGKWTIGSTGSIGGIHLKVRNVSIRLPEVQVEKLISAIGDNKVVVVTSANSKRFSFKPYRMGSSGVYIVKELDSDAYPEGVLLPASSIEDILDFQFKK